MTVVRLLGVQIGHNNKVMVIEQINAIVAWLNTKSAWYVGAAGDTITDAADSGTIDAA